MASFSQRLKQLREENNWSVRHLAKLTGISHSAITYYEMGERNPKREALEAIADVFNVDMDYLLGNSDIKNLYQLELKGYGGNPSKMQPPDFKLNYFDSTKGDSSRDQTAHVTVVDNIQYKHNDFSLRLFGVADKLTPGEQKVLAVYNKIEDKEGFIKFLERFACLSAEQQKFLLDNLLSSR